MRFCTLLIAMLLTAPAALPAADALPLPDRLRDKATEDLHCPDSDGTYSWFRHATTFRGEVWRVEVWLEDLNLTETGPAHSIDARLHWSFNETPDTALTLEYKSDHGPLRYLGGHDHTLWQIAVVDRPSPHPCQGILYDTGATDQREAMLQVKGSLSSAAYSLHGNRSAAPAVAFGSDPYAWRATATLEGAADTYRFGYGDDAFLFLASDLILEMTSTRDDVEGNTTVGGDGMFGDDVPASGCETEPAHGLRRVGAWVKRVWRDLFGPC